MSTELTEQLSEEAQEALEFLRKHHIDSNRMLNRSIMRAAQEAGWQISLVPDAENAQQRAAVEPTPLEHQPGDENTHRLAPVDPALQVQPQAPAQPAVPTPAPVEKPFEPGMILTNSIPDQEASPRPSSITKKTVVEPVAEIRKINPV